MINKKIPKSHAAKLENLMNNVLNYVEVLEIRFGDECVLPEGHQRRMNEIWDAVGIFLSISEEGQQ